MLNEDTFQYAIDNTRVIRAPQRLIDTFGSTSFQFYLVSELMDHADQVRVRGGKLVADRPLLLTPEYLQRSLLEGFGERAEEFVEWLRHSAPGLAVLKYGFQFRKLEFTESVVHSTVEEVIGRLGEDMDRSDNPLAAIIHGVDEGWEVCLLKFATDMIESSAPENLGDWRRRGLL